MKRHDRPRAPRPRVVPGVATLLAAVAAAACAGGPPLPRKATGEPLVEVRGRLRSGPASLGRADLARLPRRAVEGRDPATGKSSRFEGVDLAALLERPSVLADGADAFWVDGDDGRRLPLPAGIIRQYRPVLADTEDGRAVAPRLAWPNLEQAGLERDPRAPLWWLTGVRSLEGISWTAALGRPLRAPPSADDAVRRGATLYLGSCVACHRLAGVGGTAAPPLDGALLRLGREGFEAGVLRHARWLGAPGAEVASPSEQAGAIASYVGALEAARATAADARDGAAEPAGEGTGPEAGRPSDGERDQPAGR